MGLGHHELGEGWKHLKTCVSLSALSFSLPPTFSLAATWTLQPFVPAEGPLSGVRTPWHPLQHLPSELGFKPRSPDPKGQVLCPALGPCGWWWGVCRTAENQPVCPACLLPEPGVRPKGPQDRMTCEQCAALGPAAEEAGQGG